MVTRGNYTDQAVFEPTEVWQLCLSKLQEWLQWFWVHWAVEGLSRNPCVGFIPLLDSSPCTWGSCEQLNPPACRQKVHPYAHTEERETLLPRAVPCTPALPQ